MEEETPLTPENGEVTPTQTESVESTAAEVETSEVGTLDQPIEAATGVKPKSRLQERISDLTSERNYWRDLNANAPAVSAPEPEESDGIGIEEVAQRTADVVRKTMRAEDAQKAMLLDAQRTIEKYPELDSDDELAADVIALAQGRGISIPAAAERILAGRRQAEVLGEKKAAAAQVLRTGATTPTGTKVSSGEAAPVDVNALNENDKETHWSKILESYSQ